MNSLPKIPLESRTLTVCFILSFFICKCGFSDAVFSKWEASRLIFTDIIFHNECYHINWAFSFILASLEENHFQDEGVCSLAKGLKRNSSLKVLK